MKKFISKGENLPEWSSPISHAVVCGDTCYLSGQLAIGADGQYMPGTGREEAQRAFQNVGRVLAATGFTLQDMVFVDIAFIDLADLPEANTLFAELFPEGARPARTVYQAARLPYDARIKVSGIAVRAERPCEVGGHETEQPGRAGAEQQDRGEGQGICRSRWT